MYYNLVYVPRVVVNLFAFVVEPSHVVQNIHGVL